METFKKVLKWIAISLAIIAGIVVLIIILMMIFPGFKIFGYRFVANKTTEGTEQTYFVDTAIEYYIVANTDVFDINITENETLDELKFSYVDKKWGFAKAINTSLSLKIDDEKNIIEARMLETTGLVTGTGSLNISIPKDFACHVNLNTNDGNISVNKEHLLSLNTNLTDGKLTWQAENRYYFSEKEYSLIEEEIKLIKEAEEAEKESNSSTNPANYIEIERNINPFDNSEETLNTEEDTGEDDASGDTNTPDNERTDDSADTEVEEDFNVSIYYDLIDKIMSGVAKIEKFNIDENKYVKVTIPVEEITIRSVNIICNNASLDFGCFEMINIDNNFKIKANYLNIKLDKLIATKLDFQSKQINLDISALGCIEEINVLSEYGKINLGGIISNETASFVTDRADIIINEIACTTHINTNSGNVTITDSTGDIVATTVSGKIHVIKTSGDIVAQTKTGNIELDKYYSNARITTKTGNITAHSYSDEDSTINTEIIQDSGNIDVVTENNKISITSNKGSKINATIRNMCENNLINHSVINANGTSNIYIMIADKPFKVRAVGKVSGELATNIIMSSNDNYVYYIPSGYQDNPTDVASINCEGGTIIFDSLYE